MAISTKTSIKSFFETGDKPTQEEFEDLIDSYQDRSLALDQIIVSAATGKSGLAFFQTTASGSIKPLGAFGELLITTETTASGSNLLGINNLIANAPVVTSLQGTDGFLVKDSSDSDEQKEISFGNLQTEIFSNITQDIVLNSVNIEEAKSNDIASASSIDLSATTGNYVDITGTTTITEMGTVQAGAVRILQFDDALTLTHNATSLILPTGANITTASGDVATFVSEGSGNWRCISYEKADGEALVATDPPSATTTTEGIVELATNSEVRTGTDASRVPPVSSMQYHQGASQAWVNFDGTGSVSIRDDYNVSSITDNGLGDYTVNFSVTMTNANYAISTATTNLGATNSATCTHKQGTTPTTTAITVTTRGGGAAFDSNRVFVKIHGDR